MTRSARLIRTNRPGSQYSGLVVSPWLPIDAAVWAAMLSFAVWMRFDFSTEQLFRSAESSNFYWLFFSLAGLSSLAGWTIGLYRGKFLPGSILETSSLTIIFFGSTMVVFLLNLSVWDGEGLPRSTPLITGAFTVLASLALRSLARRKELFGAGSAENSAPALVFGAGEGGLLLVKQLRRSEISPFDPVGILDDDPGKRHVIVDGVRVYGGRELLSDLAKKTGAETLIIAVPSLPSDELIEIRDRAELIGLQVLVLPPLNSLMKGTAVADELREINVNDLLGRPPARLNQTQIAEYLRNKRILVSGAGGSIGSELCRQLMRFRPSELMMLDRDESGLHSVQLSIQDQAMLDGKDTILASIRDRTTLLEIFQQRKPQIVFHAAALKHMPLLESYPLEAYKTNVVGTLNILDAAEAAGVETFVNISTDKAANPSSALGESKRIAERLTAGKADSVLNGKYVSVRFGNVLGSRGSVLTVFEKQIRDGGPVTVTDPEVERYFMTIPEACQLVLQSAVVGKTGETLVLDMGEPVKISEVAKTLIEQSDHNRDIEIVYTGLRENEKLSEELFDDSERPTTGDRHEALSEVRVPPMYLRAEDLPDVTNNSDARVWLKRGVSPRRAYGAS